MMRRIIKGGVLFLIGIGVIAAIFREPVLLSISRNLVYEDPLEKLEAIVVLSGSSSGNRIEAAAKLYHAGFAKKLIFSGFEIYPRASTGVLMKNYAIKLGVPEANIYTEDAKTEASTRGESHANLSILKKHQINKFILLTSAYHTRRSKLIYEREITNLKIKNLELIMYAAFDPDVPVKNWWKLRTGKKGILLEYIKSVVYYFNL